MEIKEQQLVQAINDLIFRWQKKGLVYDSRTPLLLKKAGGLNKITWK